MANTQIDTENHSIWITSSIIIIIAMGSSSTGISKNEIIPTAPVVPVEGKEVKEKKQQQQPQQQQTLKTQVRSKNEQEREETYK